MKAKKGWTVITTGFMGFIERSVYFHTKMRAKEFAERERRAGKKARVLKGNRYS